MTNEGPTVRRALIATTLAVLLSLAVASATALGTFASPILSASSGEVFPCTYDTAAPLGDDGGNLIGAVDAVLATSRIASIELTGVVGDCEGHVPIAVVEGTEGLLGGATEVLFVIELPALGAGDAGTINLPLTTPISLLDDLTGLVSKPTNVRVGFCPEGATCT